LKIIGDFDDKTGEKPVSAYNGQEKKTACPKQAVFDDLP
jgi:hypothetical protein